MKAAFGVEAIGLSASRAARFRMLGMEREMYRMWRPWCALLLGVDEKFGYRREFLDPKVDYTHANSRGTRGVWFWFTLTSGQYYEARYPLNWRTRTHQFLTATTAGDVVDVDEDEIVAGWEEQEVRRRWASVDSELMF